ncbi:MAG TPA: hypothetical protein VGJ20_18095 [Xanthobacteraceae bacterium]|jgi:hypothetical protein
MNCNIQLVNWLNRIDGKHASDAMIKLGDVNRNGTINGDSIKVLFDYPLDRAEVFECAGPVSCEDFITFVAHIRERDLQECRQVWRVGVMGLATSSLKALNSKTADGNCSCVIKASPFRRNEMFKNGNHENEATYRLGLAMTVLLPLLTESPWPAVIPAS